MQWIVDHLQLVIFLVVIVVYALKAVRGKAEAGGDDAPPTRRTLPGEQDEAEAARTREIQDEIRRRILARQRGEEPSAQPPVIVFEQAPPPIPPPIPPPSIPVGEESPYEVHDEFEAEPAEPDPRILEAQRALEEQLRFVRLAREAAAAGVPRLASVSATPDGPSRRSSSSRRALRDDLKAPGSLRRAILLREILGEPVGLRTRPAGMTRR